jgi:plastocyanin
MSSKHFRILGAILAVFALGSLLLVACTRPGQASSTTPTATSSGGGGGNNCPNGTVHTGSTSFQESCVNVAKGSSLTITPATPSLHIFANGSWVNGSQQLSTEPGAPTINNVQETGSPVQIGPFNTAGTFHILCTVHPDMNLTVNVK